MSVEPRSSTMLLSVLTHNSGCSDAVRAPANGSTSCFGPCKSASMTLPCAIDLDAVDILDVGRAAPRGHQPIGRRPAVFVREDHRVAIARPARCRLDLVPHEDGHIGESALGVGTCEEHRGQSDREMLRRRPGDFFDAHALDRRASAAQTSRGQPRVLIEGHGVLPWSDFAQQQSIAGAPRPHQRHVLNVAAVQRHSEDDRLATVDIPRTLVAAHGDRRDDFRQCRDLEAMHEGLALARVSVQLGRAYGEDRKVPQVPQVPQDAVELASAWIALEALEALEAPEAPEAPDAPEALWSASESHADRQLHHARVAGQR